MPELMKSEKELSDEAEAKMIKFLLQFEPVKDLTVADMKSIAFETSMRVSEALKSRR